MHCTALLQILTSAQEELILVVQWHNVQTLLEAIPVPVWLEQLEMDSPAQVLDVLTLIWGT